MGDLQTINSKPPALAEGSSLLNFVALAVSDPNVDVGKLEALLRMQREIVSDDARAQFNAALHTAQQEMPRVRRNGTIALGGKGEIKFATWEDVDTALRPIMQRHGFSLSFDVKFKEGGGGIVEGTLMHSAGHSKTIGIPLPSDQGAGRNNLQAMGSMLAYGKRYLAEMHFNIVRTGADDDGETGGKSYIIGPEKDQLVQLLQETGADTTRFLEYMGVESLDMIEGKNFPAAVNALMAKKKKAGA